MEFIREIDIAIIGAGVAGCSVALELSRLGFRDNVVLFEQEERVLNAFRYYNYYAFGLEFKWLLKGEEYANRYEDLIHKEGIKLKLGHKLIDIDNKLLIFETSDGLIKYKANKIIYALGANENKRNDIVDTKAAKGIFSTKEFWELTVKKELDLKRVVLIGSQLYPLYSALKAAKEANVEIVALIEEAEDIKSFKFSEYYLEFIKKIPIFTNTKSINVNLRDNSISGLMIKSHGVRQNIVCDGIVFVGRCVSNSELLKKYKCYNTKTKSLDVTQNYQASSDIFLAGNIVRGYLSSYSCHQEAVKVANTVANSRNEKSIKSVKIVVDYDVEWYYPTMIDIESNPKVLTNLKFKDRFKGSIKVFLNKQFVMQKNVNVRSFNSVELGWINIELKESDLIEIEFEEADK